MVFTINLNISQAHTGTHTHACMDARMHTPAHL